MFIDIPPISKSRNMSPLSASPCRERNTGFFDLLSRRFGRRSHDELYFHNNGEEDSRSSSTDSCSSTSGRLAPHGDEINKTHKQIDLLKAPSAKFNCGYEFGHTSESNCSSDSSSDSVENTTNGLRIHRRSTSTIRRALQNFSISSRSLSCSSTPSKEQKAKKTKKSPPPAPKRILRQPVSYTYLKGMSGLPTQRVPRSSVCCHYSHR